MKEFVLRDLTEREREKLNSFIANDITDIYQYFLGIIITDLISEGEVSWDKALKNASIKESSNPVPLVCGLIDKWIDLCMEYKNNGLVHSLDRLQVRGLQYNINVLIGGFVNSIWYDTSIGSVGKKQAELEDNYTRIVLNGVPKWSNVPISVNPELMYRFVMTYVEYMGFRLIVQSDNTRRIELEMIRGIEL